MYGIGGKMAKIIDGDLYLSPMEASALLRISYKTLQRWAETGSINAWVKANGTRRRKKRKVKIDYLQTPTGYRYYRQESIKKLSEEVAAVT
jgi:excisionase family DNA binding protein